MTTPTIGFIPQDSGSNAYATRMQEILAPLARLERFQLKARLLRMLRGHAHRLDMVIVNWQENQVVSRQTRRISFRGALRMLVEAVLLKIVARRVVFVRHNLYPHRTDPASATLAQSLIDRYEALFDFVFVHSGDSHALSDGPHRRHYLPHPLYRRQSVTAGPLADKGLPERYFVVFGRIVPYKRIEYLMGQFPDTKTLVVCGEVGDERYSTRLAQAVRANIVYLPGYLSEDEAQALVAGAQAVVISHAEPNMMVSGTFFYALSLHRHVFALRTPFLDWIAPRLGSNVLTLADDVVDLCAKMRDCVCPSLTEQDLRRLENEFGDDAVRSALSVAFRSLNA